MKRAGMVAFGRQMNDIYFDLEIFYAFILENMHQKRYSVEHPRSHHREIHGLQKNLMYVRKEQGEGLDVLSFLIFSIPHKFEDLNARICLESSKTV